MAALLLSVARIEFGPYGRAVRVLGAYVSGRSREKQAAATGQAAPTLAGALVKTISRAR